MGLLRTQLKRILRMRQIAMAVLVSLVAIAAFTSGHSISGDQKKTDTKAKTENKLIGTWKMVKARYGGQEYNPSEGGKIEYKHVTPAHFMLAAINKDGIVGAAIAGPYTLKGAKYEETPEYGLSDVFTIVKGKTQSFDCKVEGNKWYHNGTLTNGLTIEEVWERAEPK